MRKSIIEAVSGLLEGCAFVHYAESYISGSYLYKDGCVDNYSFRNGLYRTVTWPTRGNNILEVFGMAKKSN
jgi:hypothetical protein